MYLPMFNPMYYLFALPALLLGLYAQYKVRSAYNRYMKVRNVNNLTGLEAAQKLLAAAVLRNVEVLETPGTLSDHYDPRSKKLFLSAGVARLPSVAALGIVAHEVGHAMQDADGYVPLKLRAGLVPVVQIGSWLGPILFILGMFLVMTPLSLVGLLLFAGTALFSLVTLPVEFDASKRAVALLGSSGVITNMEEEDGVRKVLNGAALTYVAAAAQSISTILYYVFLLGGSRRR
ncbi:MAG: zinc metallopeptidase [Anaerolineae bacterium]